VAKAKLPDRGEERHIRSQLQALAEAIRRREVILFVGGGISQNLGLPDFSELIEHLAGEMQLNLRDLSLDDYPVLAEAYLKNSGDFAELRDWMNTLWHSPSVDVSRSAVHNLLLDLDFPTIYTTNYDHWLEAAYDVRNKRYRKIVSITDLAHPRDGRTEIIKFHGDFDAEETMVLTETSYFQRMAFEAPLDIRLRADSLARPLLFLGYSLRDVNMRYLLFRLEEIWKSTPHANKRPCSYIFMAESQPAQEIVLRSRNVEPLVFADENPGRATEYFLTTLLQLVRAEDKPQKIA
jgi:SIR2-like protein